MVTEPPWAGAHACIEESLGLIFADFSVPAGSRSNRRWLNGARLNRGGRAWAGVKATLRRRWKGDGSGLMLKSSSNSLNCISIVVRKA